MLFVPSLSTIVLHFDYKFHAKCQSRSNPNFLCLFLTLAIVVASHILLPGDIHENPEPLGGCLTDNFAKKSLLEIFLSVNDFDIVILGESHLS